MTGIQVNHKSNKKFQSSCLKCELKVYVDKFNQKYISF